MIEVFRLPLPPGAGRRYRHGWHSWSVTGWVDRDRELRPTPVREYRIMGGDPELGGAGSAVGAVELPDDGAIVVGSLGLDGSVSVEGDELVGRGPAEWGVYSNRTDSAFAAYAEDLGALLGSRRVDPGPVWCSWYAYGPSIDDLLIRGLVDDLGDLPFAVVQIDDGWQRAIGDWEPGGSFPAGMEGIAGRIRESGRVAGLWLAPFLADARSELAREHPEMLLRDGAGGPVEAAFNWGGPAYALDVTRSDVLDVVGETVRQARSWGFDYLKLDFLYAAALPGTRPEEIGREAAYRQAVEVIREAAGDDCYLLACGAPIVASLGVVDGIRVGPDTAPFWENVDRVGHLRDRAGPGVADAIATTLNRLWLRDLIAVDPDVAFFRSRYCLLTPEQRGLTSDLARVCGFRSTSDPPAWLEPDERAELEEFLSTTPSVQPLGHYRFEIDGREVDFTPIVESRPW